MTAVRVIPRLRNPAVLLATLGLAGFAAWADEPAQAPVHQVPVHQVSVNQGQVNPGSIEAGHPTGHLHDRADQTWPPQPRGMRNATLLGSPGAAERTAEFRQREITARERVALARPAVRNALGRRYTRPDLVESAPKGKGTDETARLLYFSHENNTTVEVTLDKSRVQRVRKIAPTDYQPDVTDDEIVEAEQIARAYFNDRGTARVTELVGYGILAYLPEGTGFYPVRVIYISFHATGDSPPEFAAWVDLTNRQVMRIREEKS